MLFRLLLPVALLAFVVSHVLLNGDPKSDHKPVWSPDGSQIAFLRSEGNTSAIYRSNADGGNPAKLTTVERATRPVWSHDGKKIAYLDEGAKIRVMNADGSEDRVIHENPTLNPPQSALVWSPDDSRIAFNTTFEIYVIDLEGTVHTQYTDGLAMAEAKWSPDGKKIAFIRPWESSIITMDANGTNQHLVVNRPQIFDYAWSPDGTKIAFPYVENGDGNGMPEIAIVNADGSGFSRLTNNSVEDKRIAWSPNGSKIAFARKDGLYVMNADGSQQTQLGGTQTGIDALTWSSDGTHLAYLRQLNNGREIYQIEANGNNATRLATLSSFINYMPLSPDWSEMAYELYVGPYSELYVMAASGGAATKVSPSLPVMDFEWTPDSQKLALAVSSVAPALEIYMVNADGSGLNKISGELLVGSFDLSPNGAQIAMTVRESLGANFASMLYRVDTNGDNLRLLTTISESYGDPDPTWSPDGTKIAYSGNGLGLHVIDAEGGTPTTLVAGGLSHTALWSPDGRSLAFVGPGGLTVVDADGSNSKVIDDTPDFLATSLTWSPTGRQLAFQSVYIFMPGVQQQSLAPQAHAYFVHMINVDGSGRRSFNALDRVPQWSPDGQYLLYADDIGTIIVDAATGDQLLNTGLYGVDTAWSPDGRKLAYSNGDIFLLNLY